MIDDAGILPTSSGEHATPTGVTCRDPGDVIWKMSLPWGIFGTCGLGETVV